MSIWMLVVGCLVHFWCGLYIGRTVERMAWSKLIQDGLLPVPKRKR